MDKSTMIDDSMIDFFLLKLLHVDNKNNSKKGKTLDAARKVISDLHLFASMVAVHPRPSSVQNKHHQMRNHQK